MQTRKMSCGGRRGDELRFMKLAGHDQFHASLSAAKLVSACAIQECQQDLPNCPAMTGERGFVPQYNGQPKLLLNSVYEKSIQTVEGKP